MKITKFTIRVYGIVISDRKELLLSDEKYQDTLFTKFPGGGLEFGEGTRDCLKREMMEEFGQKVETAEHIYTTDFFQESLFLPGHQVLAIYYRMQLLDPVVITPSDIPFDFDTTQLRGQSLRWAALKNLTDEDLKFPLDRRALEIIREKYG